MAATAELSIEETNKLRLSLGLRPLKTPQKASSTTTAAAAADANADIPFLSSRSQEVAERIEKAQRKRAMGHKLQGPTLGDESFDANAISAKPPSKKHRRAPEALTTEIEGEIGESGMMVLQDSHILDGYDLVEDEAKLVAQESGGRLQAGGRKMDVQKGRAVEDEEEKPFVPEGARLFVEVEVAPEADVMEAADLASKRKKKAPKPVSIPKIERRRRRPQALARGLARERDEDDLNLVAAPAALSDSEDDYERALAASRQAATRGLQSAQALADQITSLPPPPEAEPDGEVLVLGSFSRVETQAEFEPKQTHRSLASSLAAMLESGDLTSEQEIVVGRASDAKPDLSLNRPTDTVKLEYRDDHGRLLTPKEAFRQTSYQMRGQKPSAKKQEKRQAELRKMELVRQAKSGDTPLHMASATNEVMRKTGAAFVQLSGHKKL